MNKLVFIAGSIGLVFGFLFSATLGVELFPDQTNTIVENNDSTEGVLNKDAEAFKIAYNLSESIYEPITGDQAYEMINNKEAFILYAGRSTCPFCQRFVPVLMEAALNQGISTLYYIDTTDPLNSDFVSNEEVTATPTTFIFSSGNLESKLIGYNDLENTESFVMGLNE